MQACKSAGGLIARAANRYVGKADRKASGVLSAAQRHTHFLDSPRMTAVLGRSDFAFGDLKRGVATVFLVLPPDRLGAYSRWLRLMYDRLQPHRYGPHAKEPCLTGCARALSPR